MRVLRAARYPGSERLPVETTTPAELLAFLEAEPGSRVVPGERLDLWRHLRRAGPRRARRAALEG